MANQLARVVVVIVGLLLVTLIACGGVADAPENAATIPVKADGSIGEATSNGRKQVSEGVTEISASPLEPRDNTPATQSPGVDDERVEALVAEWEKDLGPTKRVLECVEQALGLNRPLLPEDLQLQANQPAIVACLKAEVGNE